MNYSILIINFKSKVLVLLLIICLYPVYCKAETEPNGTYLTANEISSSLSTSFTGQLMTYGDVDWFYFEKEESGTYDIQFKEGRSPTYCEYRISFFNDQFDMIASFDTRWSWFSVHIPNAGKYYIRISVTDKDDFYHSTEEYEVFLDFIPESPPNDLIGLYEINRYVVNYPDGSTFDSDDFSDIIGNAVILNDMFLAAISFSELGVRYYTAENASYVIASPSITITSFISQTESSANYIWENLNLSISGTSDTPEGLLSFSYYLTKVENLNVIGSAEVYTEWDVNSNDRIDLPDVLNGLKVLSGM